MIDPKDYVIRADTKITNVDLDEEVLTFAGQRLTEASAEQIAEQTLATARHRNLIPGGKSLSHDGSHSPRVQFRLASEIRRRAQEQAEREGVSLSTLARKALEGYLASATR